MAHRAGGHDTLQDNSFKSAVNALSMVDGIETDVQISKDETIWMSHSSSIENCEKTLNCFSETNDAEIETIRTCSGKDFKYTRLERVMQYMQQNQIHKYISIDMKGWIPCGIGSIGIEGIMRLEVEKIIEMGNKYGLANYLFFENSFPSVLKWAKKKNGAVGVYINSYGDLEQGMLQALKYELDGITFKSNFKDTPTLEDMNLLHRKGLRLMAWNIPDSSAAETLRKAQVDILQIDLK